MRKYLETASEIHSWLSSLQVTQKWIDADIRGEASVFLLDHPILGKLEVTQSQTNAGIFRQQGIALQLHEEEKLGAQLRVYDYGGIWDPIDGFVAGEHYAASHYALLSAVLYGDTHDPHFLQHASKAFEFHRQTSPDEYELSSWMYHWDFQNYALIECYCRLQSHLDTQTRQNWEKSLMTWRANHRNKLTNWAAMRSLAYLQRHQLFGAFSDYCLYRWNERVAYHNQHKNGCIDDELNVSRPIQYHIYSVALLHRLFLLTGKERFARRFLRGVDFFVDFVDPDGDFNYWGRGQEQIFGCGPAVYALLAAAHMSGDQRYKKIAENIFDYLSQFKVDNHFPLVLNRQDDAKRFGWYDYHHTTVYNAFLAVWLGLAHELPGPQGTHNGVTQERMQVRDTGDFAFLKNQNFYVAIGKGLPHYSTEAGLTPCHLWVKGVGWIFSCPGGATEDAFGKFYGDENVRLNFLAPVAKEKNGNVLSPAGKTATITHHTKEAVTIVCAYGPFTVTRKMSLTFQELLICDELVFEEDFDGPELRLFHFPVVVDKFEYGVTPDDLILKTRDKDIVVNCVIDGVDADFESLEEIKTAKGLARVVAKRVTQRAFSKGDRLCVNITFHAPSEDPFQEVAEPQAAVRSLL
ncbi:MAG: hypothetical protein ACE5IR_01900 [bacterium]